MNVKESNEKKRKKVYDHFFNVKIVQLSVLFIGWRKQHKKKFFFINWFLLVKKNWTYCSKYSRKLVTYLSYIDNLCVHVRFFFGLYITNFRFYDSYLLSSDGQKHRDFSSVTNFYRQQKWSMTLMTLTSQSTASVTDACLVVTNAKLQTVFVRPSEK